jgi:rubrerythrin
VRSIAEIKVLETCTQVEEGAGRLYRLLAEAHKGSPELAALWEKTAREEDNHSQQIGMVIRKRDQMAAQVQVELARAEKAFDLIQDVIAHVQANAPAPRQALEDAIMLEKTLMAFHADYAVRFAEPMWEQLFKAMMAADRDHVGALESALASLRG